jgi:hypothetical protein
MKTKLILTFTILLNNLLGSADRVRFVNPEMQAAFESSSVTFPLPGRERRGGKKASESNETNAPSEPPNSIKNEVGEAPEDFSSKISALEKEKEDLEANVKELEEDLSVASGLLESYSEDRRELRKEINELKDKISDGPGSIIKGWAFSPELKWIYLSPSTMPYVYSQDEGWMMYEYGTNPRRVYYFKTKEWKILKNEK